MTPRRSTPAGEPGDGEPTEHGQVARLALRFLGPDSSTTLLSLPTGDEPTLVALLAGRVLATVELTVRGGRITHLESVVDPAKLADLNLILDL